MNLVNGVMTFSDIYDLNYELLNELSISVLPNGSLMYHNDDTGEQRILQMEGKNIIASIDPSNIHYAGPMDVTFDVLNDIKLVMTLFGFYLDIKQKEGVPFLSYFSEEEIRTLKPNPRSVKTYDIKYTALTVKYNTVSSITSHYYHNRCLKFIDMIFMMEEDLVDLSNFDIIDFEAEANSALNRPKRGN